MAQLDTMKGTLTDHAKPVLADPYVRKDQLIKADAADKEYRAAEAHRQRVAAASQK